MATYGKRKKGLLSSFSVFQDDKPEKDPKEQRSGEYTATVAGAFVQAIVFLFFLVSGWLE